MDKLKPPVPPDYDKIIEEERKRIRDYSWVSNSKEREKLEKNNPVYKNPAYNNAMVEAFESATISRLLNAKEDYCNKLDEYQCALEQRLKDIEDEINRKKKKQIDVESDFNTVKGFYDDFQNQVHKKIEFVNNTVSQAVQQIGKEED